MTILFCAFILTMTSDNQKGDQYMSPQDHVHAQVMARRQGDWRNGGIVYQVFVDRYVPSLNLDAKRHLYDAPRTLHPWTEVPVGGHDAPEVGVWTHELAFWGGDLKSLATKVDYIQGLGSDVLYLNPIQAGLTNHKYDADDWAEVAPEYGTRQDVMDLAKSVHSKGMKLILDGVFNHMGRRSPKFRAAEKDPKSPYRNWFFFGKQFRNGYRSWANTRNLVEVRLENPVVQDYLWAKPDSVVQKYLSDGVDGWRLDTAYELGPNYLSKLTESAHKAKPGSVVIGEVWNYPQGWSPSLDGIMNFYARRIVLETIHGKISARSANNYLERMVQDAGIEPLLKSWFILDNHDTDRLKSMLPETKARRLAQILQFTLPGSPVLYYGVEVGMQGVGDPGSRGPMRWDLVNKDNEDLMWMRNLIKVRKEHPALKFGDYVALDCENLIGFSRRTDKALETVVVLANPTDAPITETVSFRDGKLMNGGLLKDVLSGVQVFTLAGLAEVTVPAKTARIFEYVSSKGYTPYKRIH